jgi:hypothetical protein
MAMARGKGLALACGNTPKNFSQTYMLLRHVLMRTLKVRQKGATGRRTFIFSLKTGYNQSA